MSLKNVGGKIFNGLPIVSLYNIGNDSVKSTFGKLAGHLLYASIPLVYLVGSTLSGTSNPLGWMEAIEERDRERQEYNELHDGATKCVNTKLGFHSGTEQIELPRLKEKVLEGIAESCKSEGKLE